MLKNELLELNYKSSECLENSEILKLSKAGEKSISNNHLKSSIIEEPSTYTSGHMSISYNNYFTNRVLNQMSNINNSNQRKLTNLNKNSSSNPNNKIKVQTFHQMQKQKSQESIKDFDDLKGKLNEFQNNKFSKNDSNKFFNQNPGITKDEEQIISKSHLSNNPILTSKNVKNFFKKEPFRDIDKEKLENSNDKLKHNSININSNRSNHNNLSNQRLRNNRQEFLEDKTNLTGSAINNIN